MNKGLFHPYASSQLGYLLQDKIEAGEKAFTLFTSLESKYSIIKEQKGQ